MKKVLSFTSALWVNLFKEILEYGQENKEYHVGIICSNASVKNYSNTFKLGAKHYLIPNFYKESTGKDNNEKELLQIIKECEIATGLSINRIILAGERDIGRAYSKEFYFWPSTKIQKYCLSNNTYPEKVIFSMFRFIITVFENFKPDFVLARGHGSPLSFVAYLYASRNKVPYINIQNSKILTDRYFWTEDFYYHNILAKDAFNNKLKNNNEVSQESCEYIAQQRKKPRITNYMVARIWKRAGQMTWTEVQKTFLHLFINKLIYIIKGKIGAQPKSVRAKIFEYYRVKFMQLYHKKYFLSFDLDNLRGIKYIYFPLHKEPEMMLNSQATLWHDQRHTISYISSMLPSGYKLFVREHRFNWGRRYTKYLKCISSFPGVKLISPFDSQFKYIQNADLIITENGTVGWEGLLLNKTVITLDRTFYETTDLPINVSMASELDKHIIMALNRINSFSGKEYDKRLGLFIDSERETTLSEKDFSPVDNLLMIEKLLTLKTKTQNSKN